MSRNEMMRSSGGAMTGFRHKCMVVTTETVVGMRIERVIGLVRGNTIRARHLGRDITAMFRMIVGGEVTEYTKMMAESREQALDRMVDQAQQLGANAVLGARFTTSAISQGAAEILAFGTAVILRPLDGDNPQQL